jgi:hypothetical protein
VALSQCLGHNTSTYDAYKVARMGSRRALADCALLQDFARRAALTEAAVESLLVLGESMHTVSCCARRNRSKLAEGLTFLRLEAGLISRTGVY